MLDVQRLRVFRAVVASGSVQAAADHLGYTPSAISQHLTALQRETGLVLFEKAGRGIAPTPTAKVLAAESDELMGSLTRLGGVVDDTAQSGQLTHHLVALGGEHLGGRRGRDPTAGLLEEDQPGLPLEGGEVLADGGRGVAEMVGRGLHRTTGNDRSEDPEALDVEHGLTLQYCFMFR